MHNLQVIPDQQIPLLPFVSIVSHLVLDNGKQLLNSNLLTLLLGAYFNQLVDRQEQPLSFVFFIMIDQVVISNAFDVHRVLCVIELKVLDIFDVKQAKQLFHFAVYLWLDSPHEFSRLHQIHYVGGSTDFRNLFGVKSIIDVIFLLSPKITVLMPVCSLFLRILQSAILKNIPHPSQLLVDRVLIVKAQEGWKLNNIIPYSPGELD